MPKREMTTMFMELEKAQAHEYLKMNTINRPIRKSRVGFLRGVMNRGEWKVMHQGIAIDFNNVLLDGQHRLLAFVNSDLDVLPINVSFDCDPSTFEVIDTGLARSHADSLREPALVMAVARAIYKVEYPTVTTQLSRPQTREIMDWAGKTIRQVYAAMGTKRSKRTSASILAAVTLHMMAGHREAETQFVAFVRLEFDEMQPSVKALMRQIMDHGIGSHGNAVDMLARAWRAFDPSNFSTARIQIKDPLVAVGEMAKVAMAARRKHIAKPKR